MKSRCNSSTIKNVLLLEFMKVITKKYLMDKLLPGQDEQDKIVQSTGILRNHIKQIL